VHDDLLMPFRSSPSSAGIFLDFDGTLSEIVLVPSDARPLVGVQDLLAGLGSRFAVVSIVSGRSADELVEWLGTDVEIWGVHGAQRALGGKTAYSDRALPHRELIALVKAEAEEEIARAGLPGVIVEDKGVMIGLHFRAAADPERAHDELDRIAEQLVRKHGLNRAGGRLAFELRPPVDFSKAAVVLDRTREARLSAVMFVGDDKVDLPAFDALDILQTEGVHTVRVAVNSTEAPTELLTRSDLVVDGPAGVVELLTTLVED
jgi:trehalose 6-phosphate phosphatase